MRLLTWNVNGILTIPKYHPWNALKEYDAILDSLQADIICIQETKITRKQMPKSLAVLPSFDGFFSFLKPPAGRHGTAIFTRRSTLIPVKAEEGLSSTLIPKTMPSEEWIGGYPQISELDFGFDELTKLDSEGRTIVVDCGMFVLINLYCPNLTNDDRLKFKNDFNILVDTRVRNLIKLGRQVIVVGDLNICVAPEDTAEPEKRVVDGDLTQFTNPEYRRWLQEFVGPSGPMIDVTRKFHPDRKSMFTCWDTKTEARKSNYGARIDFILLTPGLMPWVKFADIQPEITGSDHCPVYVDFHDEIQIEGKGKVRLWDELNPSRRGADRDVEKQPNPPPFATRFYDEFSGKQKSLMGYFTKGSTLPSPPANSASASTGTSTGQPVASTSASKSNTSTASPSSAPVSSKTLGKRKASSPLEVREPSPQPVGAQKKLSGFFKPPPKAEKKSKAPTTKGKAKAVTSTAKKKKTTAPTVSPGTSNVIDITSSDEENAEPSFGTTSAPSPSSSTRSEPNGSQDFDPMDLEAAYESANTSTSQWNSIFAPKSAPLCDAHQEPARLWTVNKPGINKGRRFYLCARPVGPGYDNGKRPASSVNNEFRCDFFKWDTQVKRPAGLVPNSFTKKPGGAKS